MIIPLILPAVSAPQRLFSREGNQTDRRPRIIAKVEKRTAPLVACLRRTGVSPFHNPRTPSSFTHNRTPLRKPCRPESAALCIILILTASPGVTTKMLSDISATSPLAMLTHAARGASAAVPARLSSWVRAHSKVKKRIPGFKALEAARAPHPTYIPLTPCCWTVDRSTVRDPGRTSAPPCFRCSCRRVFANSAGYYSGDLRY